MSPFIHRAKKGIKEQLQQGTAFSRQVKGAANAPLADPNQYTVPHTARATDIYRYRYHHGANLGSIFVLEKWLFPTMFQYNNKPEQTSELEAVKASISAVGVNATRARWEQHWQTALSDSDINWLVNSGRCTTIRLPIGYFTLGPHFCVATPFSYYATIYANAWPMAKALIDRCAEAGIGVLIDLHALPGGANNQDNSGTNTNVAALWGNQSILDLATKCLCYIAQEVRNNHMINVTGIQVCNEAEYNAPGIYEWYDSVISEVSHIDATIPLYLSDAWDLKRTIEYVQSKPGQLTKGNPVIIDSHLYWAFSGANKAMSPEQIINDVPSKLNELEGKDGSVTDRGAVTVFVGEYSCVMDDQSWSQAPAGSDRNQLVQRFGNAQCARYQSRSGGCTFWTDKMDWMPGGEWGFVAMSSGPASTAAIQAPAYLTWDQRTVLYKLNNATAHQDEQRIATVTAHENYWTSTAPGQRFEHWRFEAGWKAGFTDASTFFGARIKRMVGTSTVGADVIGGRDVWIRKRIMDSEMWGEFLWEFEQGIRAGLADFYRLAGV